MAGESRDKEHGAMVTTKNGTVLPFPGGQRLMPLSKQVSFAAGTRIFRQGRRADCFWFITRGTVQLELRVPGRRSEVVEVLHGGALLGWGWLFPPFAWQFTAVATTPVDALQFDGAAVRKLCEEDTETGLAVTRHIADTVVRRLRSAHARLIDAYLAGGSTPSLEGPE